MDFGDIDTYLIKFPNFENSYPGVYDPNMSQNLLRFWYFHCDFHFTEIANLLKFTFFSDYWKLLKLSPSTEITEIEISFLAYDI